MSPIFILNNIFVYTIHIKTFMYEDSLKSSWIHVISSLIMIPITGKYYNILKLTINKYIINKRPMGHISHLNNSSLLYSISYHMLFPGLQYLSVDYGWLQNNFESILSQDDCIVISQTVGLYFLKRKFLNIFHNMLTFEPSIGPLVPAL